MKGDPRATRRAGPPVKTRGGHRTAPRRADRHQAGGRFDGLVQLISDGIVVLDREGRVQFASPRALELVGMPSDPESVAAAVGISIFDFLDPADRPLAHTALASTVERSGPAEPLELHLAAGPAEAVEVVANNLLDDPSVAGIVLTVRDVTQRRALDRMKDEFVAVVSHELRTPLTSINGALGLLEGGAAGPLPDAAEHLVKIAHRNGGRLIELVNDILDFEKFHTGRLPLNAAPVTVGEIVEDAVVATDGAATAAGVTIVADTDDTTIEVDGGRTAQALTNLLANAVKFSSAGAIVEVSARRNGDDMEFRVQDHGRGIPADRIDVIFEPFQQADATDARERSGTGLGLSITREIVERQGGRIWVDSTLGVGSTFAFALPLEPFEPLED